MATVVANNSRIHDAENNAGWSNEGGGGPAPAAEPQLAYQGSNAVNRKVTSTTARTGVAYSGASHDLSAGGLVMFKAYVADFGDLDASWGVAVGVGSSSGDRFEYNVAGSLAASPNFGAYPAAGGYLIVAVDPRVAEWRSLTQGAPNLASVAHYFAAAQFVNGGAKSENFALDALDVGTGLTLTGAGGSFADFVDFDQGTKGNRFGYAISASGSIVLRGMFTIGGPATSFTDSASKISFPDGYHGPGTFGLTIDLSDAGTAVEIGCSITGLGTDVTSDTRPDLIVNGVAGLCTITGVLENFRNFTLNAAVTASGATLGFASLTQGGATIAETRLRTNAPAGVSAIGDVNFALLTNCEFVQVGAGHAVEITTPGSYSLIGLGFSGFGADGTNAAAIYNNSGGAVTLNVSGGATPTVRNGAGSTTTVNNAVTVSLSGIPDGLEARIRRGSHTLDHVQSVIGGTYAYSYSYTPGQQVRVSIGGVASDGRAYVRQTFNLDLAPSNQTIPLTFELDPSYQP